MSVTASFGSACQPEAGRQAVIYVVSNERLTYEMSAVVGGNVRESESAQFNVALLMKIHLGREHIRKKQ